MMQNCGIIPPPNPDPVGPLTEDGAPITVGEHFWFLAYGDFGGDDPTAFLSRMRVAALEDREGVLWAVGSPGTFPPERTAAGLWADYETAHGHFLGTMAPEAYGPRPMTQDGADVLAPGVPVLWIDEGDTDVIQTLHVETVDTVAQVVTGRGLEAPFSELWALPRYADTGGRIVPCLGNRGGRDGGAAYILWWHESYPEDHILLSVICPEWYRADRVWGVPYPGTYDNWDGRYYDEEPATPGKIKRWTVPFHGENSPYPEKFNEMN